MKRYMLLGCAVGLLAASAPLQAHEDNAHTDLNALILPLELQQTYAASWEQPLRPVIQQAADDFKVPAEILLALGQLGSAFENRNGAPTIEGGYGIMALRSNTWGADSLALAAQLTGVSVDQLKLDPMANIRGAAAVLDQYARDADVDRKAGVEGWAGVLTRYAGLDAESSQLFAAGVYERIIRGFSQKNSRGEDFALQPGSLSVSVSDLVNLPQQAASGDYGPAIWDPAASCNYSTTSTNKDSVVIHTIEGSAAGARGWFKNCASNVSSHYVISEAGTVWQMVAEAHRAFHVGCYNSRSVGLEHEGFAGSPSHPQSLYDASAALTADICNSWGIPKAFTPNGGPGILGHVHANNCCCGGSHWDPGPGWDWNYYIGRVGGGGGSPNANVGDYVSDTIPGAMRKGQSYNCSVTMKNSGAQTWACWPSGTMLTVGQFNGPAVCKLIPYPFYEIYTSPCAVPVTQNSVFPFTIAVPGDAPLGNYEISWQMKDNNEWFNTTGHNAIFRKTVYVHDNFSELVGDTIPSNMTPGQSYNCSVTMKNSGSQAWACWPSGTMLTVGQFNGPQVCKLIPYPFLEIYTNPCGINPADNCTFPFTINVPADTPAGTYEISWEMKDNGCWFGQKFTKNVTVGGAGLNNKAANISNTIPSTVVRGQSYNCNIRMQNTGVRLWTSWPTGTMLTVGQFNGPEVCKLIPYPYYEIYVPQDGGSLPQENVTNPGDTCTFPFTLSIPADSPLGVYEIKWQMKDNSEWFNGDTHNTTFTKNVTVIDAAPPVVTAAISRKAHGGSGNMDLDVKAAGAVEPRSSGPTTLVVTFDKAIERVNNTLADVSLSSGSVGSLAVSGSQLTIGLSGASNGPLTVGFAGIRPAGGGSTVAGMVCFAVLTGDATGDRAVNIFDLVAVRNVLNASATAGNFRNDVTADGAINVFDLVAVRNVLNTSAAGCP